MRRREPVAEYTYEVEDEETLEISEETATIAEYEEAVKTLEEIGEEPDPADYGTFIPSIPALVEKEYDDHPHIFCLLDMAFGIKTAAGQDIFHGHACPALPYRISGWTCFYLGIEETDHQR